MDRPRRVFAVINPATGQGSVQRLAALLRRRANKHGVELEIRVTDHPEHATELARQCCENDVDIVIAVGGDGTVSEVVTGVIDADIVVGIVPTGSTNMIAKDLGIPLRLSAAADIAMGAGKSTEFDVGHVGEATFMHMAGAGYDAEIMRSASGVWKRRIGWPAYLWPAIKHLRSDPFEAEICLDGERSHWNARMVLCAIGGSIIHPRFTVGDGIDRQDGLLDVIIYNPPHALQAVTALGWILLRKPSRSRWHHQMRGRRAVLTADRPVAFEADGNPMGELPVTVEMLDYRVRIFTPRRN